jgi:hypothetical protein
MRIALLSDVHANLPALEAVLADLHQRPGVDAVYHLGDLVGYAPWPDEVVALLAEAGIPGVAGNYDSTVAADYKHCGCRYEDPVQEALSHESYAWTRAPVPDRPPAWGRASSGAASGPGPRHTDAQHGLLDGGPLRRVLPQDGGSCGPQGR